MSRLCCNTLKGLWDTKYKNIYIENIIKYNKLYKKILKYNKICKEKYFKKAQKHIIKHV